eukprot:TRINITY_DN809_c2_g1_i1.p1 TRINITY_DN809_c2_g1~~TRINITY_DN809_c2_g1_i1.p1  ORF type:complete len:120 (-),score=35.30 TRINITY_DN809_c2_g1_i1:121-480(-)
MLFWAHADDVESEERITAWGYHEESDRWGPVDTFASSVGSSKAFYDTDLQKLEYEALKEKKAEMKIDEISKEESESGNSVEYYAISDLKEGYLYAFKCVLKTRSTQAVEYIPVTVPSKK